MKKSFKKRIFDILEATIDGGRTGRTFNVFIMSLILLNVIFVILESIKVISNQYQDFFDSFETLSVLIFTVEYILRLWTCTIHHKFQNPIWGRIRFMLSPLVLVDLIAILPFYLPMIIPVDLIFLRGLRLLRIFRILKLARYTTSLRIFSNVMYSKKEDLAISFLIMFIVLFFASTLMHYAEHQAQPESFSSIPDAMWWAVSAFTTIGYGDAVPITPLGKFLAVTISIFGIGIFALPAGILASGFIEEMHTRTRKQMICPHCGKEYES